MKISRKLRNLKDAATKIAQFREDAKEMETYQDSERKTDKSEVPEGKEQS